MKHVQTLLGAALAAAAAFVLPGCATPASLPPGTSIDAARHGPIAPTGEYALPNGGRRLEFSQGSFGKETWMLDFDPKGALVSSRQVLTEQNFWNITPGMSSDEVRMRLGRPSWVFGAGWQEHVQVWNYRYAGGDCVWFQIAIRDTDRKVRDASMGQDPACDGPNSRD